MTRSKVDRKRRFGVGALLVTPDQRYLMQLRDDAASVSMRAHWGLFGGLVEPGERPDRALVRELREELGLRVRGRVAPFTQIHSDLGFAGRGTDRKIFYVVPITRAALRRLRQTEGRAMALLSPAQLLRKQRVVPWDLYGVLLHARRQTLAAVLLKHAPSRRKARRR